jgi:hypothetical protein
MATALVIALATYLLLGIAQGIRWHGFRGGVWIVVIVMTGFVWPLTLWAVRSDEQRRIAQEFRSALIELLHAERPTLEQRLAVESARARARAIMPRRVLAKLQRFAEREARWPWERNRRSAELERAAGEAEV